MSREASPTASSVAAAVPPPPADAVAAARRTREGAGAGVAVDVVPGLGVLTRRGLLVLFAALLLIGLGAWWRYATLLGAGVALGAAVLLDILMVVVRPRLSVHRTVDPPVVERHEPCRATLRVTGRRPTFARIALSDRLGRQQHWVDVDADEVGYRVPTLRRGLISIGPLTVNRVGVFGLALASTAQGEIDHVRVLPRLVPVHRMAQGRRRSAVGADESAEHGGTDLVGLHEYVPGDDLRRLHWATSARTGTLMVRDDADPATPHLTVVLDDTAPHYSDHGRADTDFEDAVEVAFALCRAAADQRQPVHLVTVSGAVDVSSSERAAAAVVDMQHMYAALAEVQPTTVATREGSPGHAARGMRLPRGLDAVAVISGALAPIAPLTEVAARGFTGVVLLVDAQETAGAVGAVRVLRAPHSTGLTALWDRTIR